jgi:hypothetical protein
MKCINCCSQVQSLLDDCLPVVNEVGVPEANTFLKDALLPEVPHAYIRAYTVYYRFLNPCHGNWKDFRVNSFQDVLTQNTEGQKLKPVFHISYRCGSWEVLTSRAWTESFFSGKIFSIEIRLRHSLALSEIMNRILFTTYVLA